MKKKSWLLAKPFWVLLVFSLLFTSGVVKAQEDSLLDFCSRHITLPYVSDGQQYKALLSEGEVAEFRVTFYGGSTYRIVACSGFTEGDLIFSLYDRNRNELFSNRDYNNSTYWDFNFESTVDCIIEAELSPQGPPSGFAIILIGFKQN